MKTVDRKNVKRGSHANIEKLTKSPIIKKTNMKYLEHVMRGQRRILLKVISQEG